MNDSGDGLTAQLQSHVFGNRERLVQGDIHQKVNRLSCRCCVNSLFQRGIRRVSYGSCFFVFLGFLLCFLSIFVLQGHCGSSRFLMVCHSAHGQCGRCKRHGHEYCQCSLHNRNLHWFTFLSWVCPAGQNGRAAIIRKIIPGRWTECNA